VTRPVFVLARVVSVLCLVAMVALAVAPVVILVGGWLLLRGSGIGTAGVLILAVTFVGLLVLEFVVFAALSVVKLAADCVTVVSYHGEDVARVIDGVMETRGEGEGRV
jgi:hypothetical protein